MSQHLDCPHTVPQQWTRLAHDLPAGLPQLPRAPRPRLTRLGPLLRVSAWLLAVPMTTATLAAIALAFPPLS